MKLRIETEEGMTEPELLLRCPELNEEVLELQRQLQNLLKAQSKLAVTRDQMDCFLRFSDILFMETDGSRVAVHTAKQIYFTRQKLYELEDLAPTYFMRVSKSTILNLREVVSIRKNITGASEIEFAGTDKKTFVSRNYYKELMARLAN